ncbi:MAG: sterol desaturase family protein [Thermodesulfovibrionales bacterium]|jgi:sterol desaturase/sphingolipid hydroxylase (fatty acid hydroxylase superfamily)
MESMEIYQTVTLVVVVLFFDSLERRRPRYRLDRKKELPLNILALLVVIVAGEAWKGVIMQGLAWIIPTGIPGLAVLHQLPGWLKIVTGIVVADFFLYWVHWAMHRKLLWPTHIFHHSIEELWWLSGSRTSVTHLFLFALPQIIIVYVLLALSPGEAGVAFSFGVAVNVWIHTNISMRLGPLEWLIITPDFHRVHHGSKGLSNMNLGFVFTVWDRLFGTFVDPHAAGEFTLGFARTRKRLIRMVAGL